MKVKDFLNMLCDNMTCDFKIHWQQSEDDYWIITDLSSTVEFLFGDWFIEKTESLYFSNKDNILHLYIEEPKN